MPVTEDEASRIARLEERVHDLQERAAAVDMHVNALRALPTELRQLRDDVGMMRLEGKENFGALDERTSTIERSYVPRKEHEALAQQREQTQLQIPVIVAVCVINPLVTIIAAVAVALITSH